MTAFRFERALVWFRRDLRDCDNAALAHALTVAREVFCAFVYDRDLLDALPSRQDRRVAFIAGSLHELDAALRARGGGLIVRHGIPRDAIPALAADLGADLVCANRDYEPAAIERDCEVERRLASLGIAFATCRDQVIFERDEIRTQAGTPYGVFTPYKRAWLAALTPERLAPCTPGKASGALMPPAPTESLPTLESIGFAPTDLDALGIAPGMRGARLRFERFRSRIDDYHALRDFPAQDGSSRLSVDLRFGTISIRELAAFAFDRSLHRGGEGAASWLSELVWREFYAQLLWHHPRVVAHAFRPEFDSLVFPGGATRLAAWQAGLTGYPIVDAAMRQLAATGFMHNRLRMIAASFLVKDLLVDWRAGERHFAHLLLDYDLASNNGGWQWAASTGSDAQPYFRIFNPVAQSRRFDPDGRFIRRHVPELAPLSEDEIHAPWQLPIETQRARGVVVGRDYPPPIVDHDAARRQALALFGKRR